MNFTLNFHVALLTLTSYAPFLGLLSHVCVFMQDNMDEAPDVHLQARLFAVQCMIKHGAQLPKVPRLAFSDFQEQWNSQYPRGQPGHVAGVRAFMRYNYTKLLQHFTLLTVRGGGRPFKVPDGVARECARILAQGYMQQRYLMLHDMTVIYVEHVYCTSMKNAVQHSPRLQQVLVQYDVTTQHLLRRCKEADPQLVYKRLPMKRALPDRTVQARMQFGAARLVRLVDEPNLLFDIWYMDECTVWVGRDLVGKLMVWCHRGALEGEAPQENQWLARGAAFKISFMLVVSARYGHVYSELLTGTKDLGTENLQRFNPEMRATVAALPDQVYKVRLVT